MTTSKQPSESLEVSKNILTLLKKLEKDVKYSKQKDVVLVLGNRDVGKNTFMRFLAGINYDFTKNFDKKFTLPVNYPSLVEDEHTNNALYDCPGYDDTQSVAQEVSTTYFMKKLIDFVDYTKLVFTIRYSDEPGVNEQNFMSLIEYGVRLLNNIENFQDSIALVITEVPRQKGPTFVSDKIFKQNLAEILKSIKDRLLKQIDGSKLNNKSVKFLDILLMQENGIYKNLGIFKKRRKFALFKNSKVLQENKKELEVLVYEKIQYTKHNKSDFIYTLSSNSKSVMNNIKKLIYDHTLNDIKDVGEEIKKYYRGQENLQNDVEAVYEKVLSGYNTFLDAKAALTNILKPQDLIEVIDRNLNVNQTCTSLLILQSIKDNITLLLFADAVTDHSSESKLLELSEGLTGIVKYLGDSQEWYNFLMKLYTCLSKYQIQKNISQYSALALNFSENYSKNRIHRATEILKNLLGKVNDENFEKEYKLIENMEVDKIKLKFLNEIINSTLLSKVTSSCCNNTLTVQGQFVKLSDIDKETYTLCDDDKGHCSQPKSIEVFALDKIFIDTDLDKTGHQLQLSIVAPTWHVINQSKIVLDGRPGEAYYPRKAQNGIDSLMQYKRNGQNGNPGTPGNPSGSFTGIGKIFVNGENLTISVKGGKGGAGQDGGDGMEGRDGNVPEKEFLENAEHEYLKNSCQEESEGHFRFWCTLDGEYCTDGGNGGDGGAGGKGGLAKEIKFIELEKASKISIDNTEGEIGKGGIEGIGKLPGKAGKKLFVYVRERTYTLFRLTSRNKIINHELEDHPECKPGAPGIAANNTAGMQYPVSASFVVEPIDIINRYKKYLRRTMHGNIQETALKKFLGQLENHKRVEELYDALGFVNELRDLEDLYYKSSNQKLSFLPSYKTLLQRTKKYVNTLKNNETHVNKSTLDKKQKEQIKVLDYLCAAIRSKINNLQKDKINRFITDLPDYLESIAEDFDTTRNLNDIVAVRRLNNDYGDKYKRKIEETLDLIKTKISPELDNILKRIDDEIDSLINETISRQNTIKNENAKLVQYRQKLQDALFMKSFLGITKMVSQFLSFTGPLGALAGSAIDIGTSVASDLISGEPDAPLFEALPAGIKTSMTQVEDILKDRKKLFKEQLDDAQRKLELFSEKQSSNSLTDVKEKIFATREELDRANSEGHSFNITTVNEISNMRTDIRGFLEKKKDMLEHQTDVDEQLKVVDHIKNVMSMAEITLDLYKNIKNDTAKIDEVGQAIQQKAKQLNELENYEKYIYQAIIPFCNNIQNTKVTVETNLKNKSHVALDVSKWQMQTKLNKIKRQIEKMTNGFEMQQKEFIYYIEQLDEGLTEMIKMYDIIQGYQDHKEFADFITRINSHDDKEMPITNENLKSAVDDLKLIIHSNIVLEDYEKVIKAFGQYAYPFIDEFKIDLPNLADDKPNDISILVATATRIIRNLKSEIRKHKSQVYESDNGIINNFVFSEENDDSPFNVWHYDVYKHLISKLLDGEEITIKSDIKKGLKKNAVKFSKINIRFKLANVTLQSQFDMQLANFGLSMTHLGNSHYRCDDKFYSIPSNKLTLLSSFGKFPLNNNVNDKIKEPLLSPYAMWSIKLTKRGKGTFESLRMYKNEPIDLILEGTGLYFDFTCSDDLTKYYTIDDDSLDMIDTDMCNKQNSGESSESELSTASQYVDQIYQRKRRSVDKLNSNPEKTQTTHFATSGAYKSIKTSYVNSIANFIRSNLITFGNLNPIVKISKWFAKDEKNNDINNVNNNNNYNNISNNNNNYNSNNKLTAMKLLNIQPAHTKLPKSNIKFLDNESPTIENMSINNSSFCDHYNSLLLLDFLIRWKNGIKYKQQNSMVNKNPDSEYVQTLVYRKHVPRDRSSSVLLVSD